VIQRKLQLFERVCRMNDGRKFKLLVFGITDRNNMVGQLHDIVVYTVRFNDWCRASLQELSSAQIEPTGT